MILQITLTQTLMTILENENLVRKDISILIEHAKRNKVLLQFLRELSIKNNLRQKQEATLCYVYSALTEIASQIQNLDDVVIKFFKPMAYIPSDIDLLLKKEQINTLSQILKKLGYKCVLIEPNCVTFEGKVVIDVYINPDVLNIPYLVGEKLLQFSKLIEVDGVKIKKLTD